MNEDKSTLQKIGKEKWVAVSGGFDPLHIGHVRMFEEARALGGKLVVILNNDNWLMNKKGFVFMPQEERKEVLLSLAAVDDVVITEHELNGEDKSVSLELRKIRPSIFANGGDRGNKSEIPETAVCEECDIEMVFNVGYGGKIQSSSWLTNGNVNNVVDVRPWGSFEVFKHKPHYWIKTISVLPGKRLSLQKHSKRSEVWTCVDGEVEAEISGTVKKLKIGDTVTLQVGEIHRLSSSSGGTVVEVAYGDEVREDDIERIEDDYGRI